MKRGESSRNRGPTAGKKLNTYQRKKKKGFSQSSNISSLTIMCWNCCGLRVSTTNQRLREVKKKYFSDILFLSEIKDPCTTVQKSLELMGYEHNMTIEPHSAGLGGLALFWKKKPNSQLWRPIRILLFQWSRLRIRPSPPSSCMVSHTDKKRKFGTASPPRSPFVTALGFSPVISTR